MESRATGVPAGPGGWRPEALATLAAVAETIVAGDGGRRAALAAAALDEAADPAQVAQLRLVLRAFESRAANLILVGRPVRFRELDQDGRERYLLAWATSRIPQRRTAFQALKRILAFLAYADPGEDGRNRRLAAIGYDPRPEPLTPEPTPVRPFDLAPLVAATVGAGTDAPLTLDADVVVVGSGAAGGVVAADLARAGRAVVVLEAGPFVSEPDMPVDELDAFGRVYLNRGLNASWDGGVVTLVGTGVGGGTLVNWMTSLAPPEGIRRRWARDHGLEGFDGPETDADLAALDAELGVGPAHCVPPKDEVLLRGSRALGWEHGVTPRNGLGCEDCGRCGFGCRRGAKQSGIRVHLAEACRLGARIVPDAPVDRVLVERGRAVGVEGRTVVDGVPRRLVVRSATVVVAAGTLRTPLVLARSGLDHPAIGRHLRLHPVAVTAGVMDEDVVMWEGTTQAARSAEFLGDGDRDRGGFLLESAPGTPGLVGLVFPWEGRRAFTELMARARRIAPVLGIVREHGEGRVRATPGGRARIDYVVAPRDREQLRRALAAGARLLRAAGAPEIVAAGTPPSWFRAAPVGPGKRDGAFEAWVATLERFSFAPNRGTVVSAHQMGTARAGADARDHACDPWGRVRTEARPTGEGVVGGLWVADASLFPTSLGVNPMITTMAMARRVARAVVAATPRS